MNMNVGEDADVVDDRLQAAPSVHATSGSRLDSPWRSLAPAFKAKKNDAEDALDDALSCSGEVDSAIHARDGDNAIHARDGDSAIHANDVDETAISTAASVLCVSAASDASDASSL